MNADLLNLVRNIEARKPLAAGHPASAFGTSLAERHRELYRNRNEKLGIDFAVEVLDFPGTQTFDARVVRIAAGRNNELHKHAHESLFYVISGKAEVRIAEEALTLEPGGLAFVPRWAFHQSKNLSDQDELVILAITDFGLTKAVLGDYDKRTRLAENGVDVMEHT
ncbi:MAG: cupin domain-containing protein [Novosphingobium sp.]|uniref:cupin domain-containing protein n=1 Tax=Novosphingobium sp. TaxID=1874826 RepID=UPI0032B73E32